MDSVFVGIDVSKDRLDVAVRPSGEVFAVARNAAGLEVLAERLKALSPQIVMLEATGGFCAPSSIGSSRQESRKWSPSSPSHGNC